MVVDDDDDFLSQRKVPELALVVPNIGETSITLTAPGMEDIDVPLQIERDDDRLVTATVHNKPIVGQIVGEDLNEWFTDFLPRYKQNRRFRLLHVRNDLPRYIKERYRAARGLQSGRIRGWQLDAAGDRAIAGTAQYADGRARSDGSLSPQYRGRR
jgi:uncharacterized protein YcbX